MSEKETHLSLLPNGFIDLLPPDAEREYRAIGRIMQIFAGAGYERVKPPLAEFEDSLLAPGPGAALSNETFRVMDPVSHRMMGIRSDITPQIARIASSRLAAEERPLRITYANDILRTRGSQQRTERQFCQVGCELIGADSAEADVEICVLSLIALKALGLTDITIDLALPKLVAKIFDEAGITGVERAKITESLNKRDRDVPGRLKGAAAKQFAALLEAGGEAEQALKALAAASLPRSAADDLEKLKTIYAGIKKALGDLGFNDVNISIDPLESKGFEYHDSFGFTLFAKNVRGELGRGGRYTIHFGESKKGESATGFTLYMDTIRKALPVPQANPCVFVSAKESWAVMKSLQEQGFIVVRGEKPSKRCTHIYKNGKAEKI
jgi:ATP phosphoribosyltransferase regulatory subunit